MSSDVVTCFFNVCLILNKGLRSCELKYFLSQFDTICPFKDQHIHIINIINRKTKEIQKFSSFRLMHTRQ